MLSPYVDDGLARRNAFVLALAQAMGGAFTSITIALGGLVGVSLLGQGSKLATLPVSIMIVGTACGTIPAAMLLARLGRKRGFMLGALIAVAGGLTAFASIMNQDFLPYCLGTFLNGFAFAFVQQYRFAATEAASERFRPKAISYVLAGGIFAGVIGPQTVIASKDLFLPIEYAGAYLAQAGLCLVTIAILAFYRPVPQPPQTDGVVTGRPLRAILAEPKVALAILCAVVAYSVMSLVMTAAPLAMVAHGHGADDAALGIQWHVIAMFAPSFVTGSLIARFGSRLITAIGLTILAGAGTAALLGVALHNFYLALILLGLGWNFGFIGGTAMLTESQRPEERARTQGANEFIVFGTVALASLSSGVLFQLIGWTSINWTLMPMVALPLTLIVIWSLATRRERRRLA